MTKCDICGKSVELFPIQFPQRKPPHNEQMMKPLYFSDKYIGGSGNFYCGAQCSLDDYQSKKIKE